MSKHLPVDGVHRAQRHTHDSIYRWIAGAIFDQTLPSGTKLPEDSLGDIFSVSRTVVRKALLRLNSEKLVDMWPNRGAAVASPTIDDARAVFETRRVLEAATMRAAMARISSAERAHLQQMLDHDYESAGHDPRRELIRHSGDFHLEIARIAGNEVMSSFLRELIGRTSLIIGLYEATDHASCTRDEHARLLACIAQNDAEAAAAEMVAHLDACEQRLGLAQPKAGIDLRAVFSGV